MKSNHVLHPALVRPVHRVPSVEVVLPAVRNQPSSPSEPGWQDPYSRPSDEVSVAEWRVMIAAIAGRFRISQGFTRSYPLPQNRSVLVAANDRSIALFVHADVIEVGGGTLLVGPDINLSSATSATFMNTFDQVLLPKERLWVRTPTAPPITLRVTELTI